MKKISKLLSKQVSKRFTVNKVVNFCKRKMRKSITGLAKKEIKKVNIYCLLRCLLTPPMGVVNSKLSKNF